jgi:hypothetical protein
VTAPVLLPEPETPAAARSGRRSGWRRQRVRTRRARWLLRLAILSLIVLLLPVPWRHHVADDPPGFAWRLSGRLHIEGRAVDPPGRWSWLTVGRPPVVGESVWHRLRGEPLARDLRDGSKANRPAVSDPIAVAVGLNAAGAGLPMTILVEASGAVHDGLPDPVVLARLNGIDLVDRAAYERALERPRASTWFWTTEGTYHRGEGLEVPYLHVTVTDVAPPGLDARIGSNHPALRWVRNLAVGSSHGLIVSLMTYADASGIDLAQGRHIAGTGRMTGDGTVGRIGGLPAKAEAARRAGADVLVFPSFQAAELSSFDPGDMQLIGVVELEDAVAALIETAEAAVQAAP